MLRSFSTLVNAVNPYTGQMEIFEGINVIAKNMKEAQDLLDMSGFKYMIVNLELLNGLYIFNNN